MREGDGEGGRERDMNELVFTINQLKMTKHEFAWR